jgi:DNA-binding IscR family transcriptional regulator
MNAVAMEPSAIGEFVFGDQSLHVRFSTAIALLAAIVMAYPRPMSTATLAESLGESTRTIRALLACLQRSGLIFQDDKTRDAWKCPATPGEVTLADVFRSVASEWTPPRRKKAEGVSEEPKSTAQLGVDLLLMQATMAINQVVLQHLQSFDLGRLKAVGSPVCFRPFSASVRSYVAEPS